MVVRWGGAVFILSESHISSVNSTCWAPTDTWVEKMGIITLCSKQNCCLRGGNQSHISVKWFFAHMLLKMGFKALSQLPMLLEPDFPCSSCETLHVREEWSSAANSSWWINNRLHSPLSFPSSLSFYRCLSFFFTSPCLPLWHGFKPSHIIRESRASLLRLWGFPSLLYNDLPVGLFWCWRRSLPASLAQLWHDSSLNRTHFVLSSVFGTSCSCTTPAADSFVLLTAGFFFLHHLSFSPLL